MTLPTSGPITSAQIRAELQLAPGTPFTIPADVRVLTGISSGPIRWPQDFWGKSLRGVSITYSSFTGGNTWNSVPINSPNSIRRVYIGLIHGFVANNPGNAPSLTVDGSPATRIIAASTGGPTTPAAIATGCAWFQANPANSTANISASWTGMTNFGIIVVTTTSYTTVTGSEVDGGSFGLADGTVGPTQATSNGLFIGLATYSSTQTPVWTELGSNRLTWNLGWTGSTGNSGGIAWLVDPPQQAYHLNPNPNGQGAYMSGWIALGP